MEGITKKRSLARPFLLVFLLHSTEMMFPSASSFSIVIWQILGESVVLFGWLGHTLVSRRLYLLL